MAILARLAVVAVSRIPFRLIRGIVMTQPIWDITEPDQGTSVSSHRPVQARFAARRTSPLRTSYPPTTPARPVALLPQESLQWMVTETAATTPASVSTIRTRPLRRSTRARSSRTPGMRADATARRARTPRSSEWVGAAVDLQRQRGRATRTTGPPQTARRFLVTAMRCRTVRVRVRVRGMIGVTPGPGRRGGTSARNSFLCDEISEANLRVPKMVFDRRTCMPLGGTLNPMMAPGACHSGGVGRRCLGGEAVLRRIKAVPGFRFKYMIPYPMLCGPDLRM